MKIVNRLKIVSFFQYFIWGSWLVTLSSYMINTLHFTGAQVGIVYSANGIAALLMPSIIGIIADKWVAANRLFTICHLVGAGVLIYAASVQEPTLMFWVMLVNAMAFIPTISLSNSISYSCLEQNGLDSVTSFPPIRIFGTIGFIVAMWIISLFGYELSNMQLYLSAAASLFLSVYSLTLPTILTAKKKQNQGWINMLGLDAFVLFRKPSMVVFFIFSILLGATLQISNTFSNPYLHDFALNPQFHDSFVVKFPSILLSVSQMAEVLFILAIPFFLKRYGIKNIMLISILAWTLRFTLMVFGDPSQFGFVLLLLAMLVYGCAFDFFNISGSIFLERETSSDIRASAQGLFMTMVNGIGAYAGSIISGFIVDYFTTDGVKNWQMIWLIFASYALVLAVLFIFVFRYKHDPKKLSEVKIIH